MKRRDLERHLRSHGCREIGGSKHAKWRGPQGQVSALPRHKPGILGLPPLDTWLYTVKPEDGSNLQTDIPEYNLVLQTDRSESPT